MEAPTPEDVRSTLAPLDARQQKIVAGLFTVMVQNPPKVRDREWMSEQLTHLTLLAGDFEADTPADGVQVVQDYLRVHAMELVSAAILLFQRVGLDLAPRAEEGFTIEDAMKVGLSYFPPSELDQEPEDGSGSDDAIERDMGEQPLARLMAERGLAPSDLVGASEEQLTHKMVKRAMKGRRLTANVMGKVERAFARATADDPTDERLFDYKP